ncbi:MAG: DUF1727 domain-containing protein [Clostridiales bacterium]|nr:DUF1727 domain-containing protein [Clostridiales bacterium]
MKKLYITFYKKTILCYNSSMYFRKSLSLIIAKTLIKFLRTIGRGGTSLPGKLALKIYPNILKELSSDISSIVVTGTNGKTTTSKIISTILEQSNMSFISNKSGANLISGIATVFIESHKKNYKYALLEIDEAAFKTVSKHIDVRYLLVTNLFRDQLDRFGEITHTLANIVEGISNCPLATICINADCSLLSSIGKQVNNKIIFYGINQPFPSTDYSLSDAPYCFFCKTKYDYSYRTFGHLGGFSCPNCGYKRITPDIAVTTLKVMNEKYSKVDLIVDNNKISIKINLPGEYNIYNGISAFSIGYALNIDYKILISSLATFKSGFGRMENMSLNGVDTNIILVKNPAGLNSVINYLSSLSKPFVLTLILNDQFADGTDVSWIWDVLFENLISNINMISHIYISGIRKYDMALRLKYANLPEEKITICKTTKQLINIISDPLLVSNTSYILPTYTAMFDLRKSLKKQFKLKEFWK